MPNFRKKPVVVEAVQWKGDNELEVMDFVGKRLEVSKPPSAMELDHDIPHAAYRLVISTLEGEMTASRMDWIIKGVSGEFYPCKPDIFAKTYELASTPPSDPVEGREKEEMAKAMMRFIFKNQGVVITQEQEDNSFAAFLAHPFYVKYAPSSAIPQRGNEDELPHDVGAWATDYIGMEELWKEFSQDVEIIDPKFDAISQNYKARMLFKYDFSILMQKVMTAIRSDRKRFGAPIPQSENRIEGEPEAKDETPVEYIQRMQVEATDNQEVPRCGCKSGEDCDARCMPSYDSQDIERAYCAGYINGSSAVGSCIQAMGDGKLESAWKRYANSDFVAHCIAREDTEITELLKTKEAEISSLKEKLDKAKDLSRDWYDEKNRAEILEGKLGKQEIDIADLYAFKDLSVKQGLRIKVLEKEIEVARQTAQRFLEQNVLLVDERGRYLEAAEKARAVAALDWAARNRLEKYSPGWSIARPGAWQIETFKELLKVYDAFADDELEKNKTHQP